MSGKLIVICAPSGAGKTTIVHHILENIAGIEFSISATSRSRRPTETDGIDYYFLTVDDFQQKIREDAFLEWEEVYPNAYYGTLKEEIERIWRRGNHVIFDVDVEGGVNIKRHFGKRALLLFIKPPSIEALRDRLKSRNTESDESFAIRLAKAEKELAYASMADIVLVNDELERTFIEAKKIVTDFLVAEN